jgi:hypothetical protein
MKNNSVAVDMTAVAKIWSHSELLHKGEESEDGNLRGGDFVGYRRESLHHQFSFERESKIYGLTAGHLADIGDQLEILESQADEDSNYQH